MGGGKASSEEEALEQVVAQVVATSDTPEGENYARSTPGAAVRNTVFEAEKSNRSKSERKRRKINNVEDLLKAGSWERAQINWLFVGLARPAGFQGEFRIHIGAQPIFLQAALMNFVQLNADVTVVKGGWQGYFLRSGSKSRHLEYWRGKRHS